MLFRDIIYLVNVTQSVNDYGDYIDSETLTPAYANKKSIRQSEFYQAFANGLRPELMFVIRNVDYNNQTKLYFNSKAYNIIRAFTKNDELIELVCEGIVGTEKR